jgi:ATP-dependent Lon protease
MRRHILVGLAAVSLTLAAAPLYAHHAFSSEFDADKPLQLSGTVSKMEWVNPHAWIHIDVKKPDGTVEKWMIEGGTPNAMFRRGFTKDSLLPGTEILVDGYQAKNGTLRANGRDLKLPDGRLRILAQGLSRARVEYFDETSKPYLQAKINVINEPILENPPVEITALIRNVRSSLEKAVNLGKNISSEVMVLIVNLDDPGRLADLVASNLELKTEDAQTALDLIDSVARLKKIHELVAKELELLTVQQEINIQAKGEIDKSQREFYLRQQLKAIQQELGEGSKLSVECPCNRSAQ